MSDALLAIEEFDSLLKAQVPVADWRQQYNKAAREASAPQEDVQDAAGHADPRTTRRYDRGRHSLDRHASYTVNSLRAE